MTDRSIIVTGGAGFIGSCLIRQLLSGNALKVVNFDKLTYAGHLESLDEVSGHPSYEFVHGDICDGELLSKTVQHYQPEAIINLAAETHVDRSIDGPADFVSTNVVGTSTLLEAIRSYWDMLPKQAKDRFRLIHVSTDEVYGTLGSSGLFSETSPYQPNSPYAASKASADHFVRSYYVTFGLPTITVNCSNNYGPRQFPEKLIPLMIQKAIRGEAMPVYGDGLQVRDWLYVEDHARALQVVLQEGKVGETYNIGGRCELTNLKVVQMICAEIDRRVPNRGRGPSRDLIEFVADRPGHDRRYAIDPSKIEQQLGWKPVESFQSGITKTVDWYLQNETWINKVSSDLYGGQRLGHIKDSGN